WDKGAGACGMCEWDKGVISYGKVQGIGWDDGEQGLPCRLLVAFGGSKGQITGKFEENYDEGFLVRYSLCSKAFRPITKENKANKTGVQKKLIIVQSSKAKNGDEKLNEDTDSKINKEPLDQEDQAFLEELERLKRQAKEANDADETLRKTFAQSTEDLLLQAGAARASSTNYVNTSSTPVNAASTPLNTASTSTNQDDILEELLQFKTQQVWILVDLPFGKKVIGTKWVYRNKKDKRGVVVRNKARLVAQGHRQEERIDYDEVFAHVARTEAIMIFLAFASYMGFIVYQMDVKSTFLYGKIDKEVYVSQPLGFIDPIFLNKVYKVVKALYGLHQAPKAWYATLSTFLVQSRYRKALIDKTLFIKKDKKDIMLDKYVAEILKKFDFMSVKTASTLIKTKKPLVKDAKAADVDVRLYRSTTGSLMYLITSRPDINYAICACSRFQVTPKTSHLHVVERIFRYLKGQPKLGLWYPRESTFDLEAYSDSDYAEGNLDRKSTTREAEYFVAASCCGQLKVNAARLKLTTAKVYAVKAQSSMLSQIQALVDGKRVNIKESSIRRTLRLDDVEGTSYLTNIEIFEGLAKMGDEKPSDKLTFYKAFFSSQWKFLIHTILQCLSAKTTSWNEFNSTMASAIIYEQNVPSHSNDLLPSGDDSLKLKELMDLCTNLSNKVPELEREVIDIKSTYQEKMKKLKGKVERLKDENKVLKELKTVHSTFDADEAIMEKEKSSKQGMKLADIDADVEINLEKTQVEAYNLDLDHQEKVLSMMDVNEEEPADVEEVLEVVKAAKLMTEVVTIAGATKVNVPRKRKGVTIQDPVETTTIATVEPKVQAKDKGKAILIEEPKPLKRQAQIKLDEEVARQLEVELNVDIN
nr:hypothetical protein [Tanacetum cinerariifolium]